MTDRELLEAAAKALGWRWSIADLVWYDDQAGTWTKDWNPLIDDGDALRLAVEMRFTISPCASGVFVSRDLYEPVITQHWEDGRLATTRRAIVRAAAAMAAQGERDA